MEHKCSKCTGEMETGLLLEIAEGYLRPVEWIAGSPELNWLGNVKMKNRARFRTETWRCKSCGYLDSYALLQIET